LNVSSKGVYWDHSFAALGKEGRLSWERAGAEREKGKKAIRKVSNLADFMPAPRRTRKMNWLGKGFSLIVGAATSDKKKQGALSIVPLVRRFIS